MHECVIERDQLWAARSRRAALPALAKLLRPTTILQNATVPSSKITAMLLAVQDIGRRSNLTISTFSYAGEGNLHPTIFADDRNNEKWYLRGSTGNGRSH